MTHGNVLIYLRLYAKWSKEQYPPLLQHQTWVTSPLGALGRGRATTETSGVLPIAPR